MATYTPQHPELIERDSKTIFFKNHDMIEILFEKLFKNVNSTKAYEDGMRVAALGTFADKPEGAPIGFDDPVSGAKVRIVHTVYALGYRVSREMMEDDQHAIIRQIPADLGDSARDHKERLAWGLVNDGFSGSTYTGLAQQGGTTRALFSASQTSLKTGTTQSNLLSPVVALSVTGLEALMTRAAITTSEEDRYINMNQSTLVYHPNLQHTAFTLLATEFRPGTSDNDRSTVVSSRSGLTPLAANGVPYLTSTTAWYIFSPKGQNDLRFNSRRDLEFSSAQDSDTLDVKNYANYRASVNFFEWRGAWGRNS